MHDISLVSKEHPISKLQIEQCLDQLLQNYKKVRKILIIPPDFTRCYSMAGVITQMVYKRLAHSATIHIMPALGTHMAMNREERLKMFGDQIPEECYLVHHWQTDTISIGTVPKNVIRKISNGLFETDIEVEVNQQLIDGGYDLILSIGQVVPHEVVGMANYSKNIFVGLGGRQMINKTHMLSAVCGMEKAMGNDHTPARQVFDYAQEHFLKNLPLVYILTVTTIRDESVNLNGLYIGASRKAYEQACALSQELNITYIDRPVKKMVAYLDEFELKTTWVGNKGIYRTRMAVADGGDLILLAPGVKEFGENQEVDQAIRQYGYKGRDYVLDLYHKGVFENRMMVAAHLIQGSSDGRFKITYATNPKLLSKEEVERVGFAHMDLQKAYQLYDPEKLNDGFNTLPNGEEIYFVRTPALGLWKLTSSR